jgi:hypothetical protein
MKYLPYIILIIISIFIGYSLHGDKKFTNNIHDTIYINHTDTFISHYPVVVDSFNRHFIYYWFYTSSCISSNSTKTILR